MDIHKALLAFPNGASHIVNSLSYYLGHVKMKTLNDMILAMKATTSALFSELQKNPSGSMGTRGKKCPSRECQGSVSHIRPPSISPVWVLEPTVIIVSTVF